ncbi:MAG: cation transporter [Clostridia bacterium]|nr:cation transporter [Clostridia bacterium]
MKFKYTITGLDCPNCAQKLATLNEKEDGISSCKINFLTEKITIEADLAEGCLLDLVNGCAKRFDKNVKIEK